MLFYHCQVWTDYIIWYQLFNVGKLGKILTEYKYPWKLKHAGNINYALIILNFNSLILTWLIILQKNNPLSFVNNKKNPVDFLNDNYIVLGHDSSKMIGTIQNSNMTCIFSKNTCTCIFNIIYTSLQKLNVEKQNLLMFY